MFYQVLRKVFEKFTRLACICRVFLSVLLYMFSLGLCSCWVQTFNVMKHLCFFLLYCNFLPVVVSTLLVTQAFFLAIVYVLYLFSIIFVSIFKKYSSCKQNIVVAVASCLLCLLPRVFSQIICHTFWHVFFVSISHPFLCFSILEYFLPLQYWLVSYA